MHALRSSLCRMLTWSDESMEPRHTARLATINIIQSHAGLWRLLCVTRNIVSGSVSRTTTQGPEGR